jgi:outer membrane receptor protein involved in Fe transport
VAGLVLVGLSPLSVSAQSVLDPLVVTVSRAPQPASTLPVRVDVFGAEDIAAHPATAIDDRLRASAAFTLFRRTGSGTANPTAQGVALRGLGPSGAGRALVLLDGVPLNDPFGGWITWTRLPVATLAGAEIVRGGGSGTWGNQTLGGTVQLFTAPPDGRAGRLRTELGDRASLAGELLLDEPAGPGVLRFVAAAQDTAGAHPRPAARRGAVDRPTHLRTATAQLGWHTAPDAFSPASLTAGWSREARGNGTVHQRNATTAAWLTARAQGELAALAGAPDWSATAHLQTQEFSSLFTAVSPDRATETPVLDQFAVPARAAAVAGTLTWEHPGGATTLGTDARHVRGETREAYLRVGEGFTRQRIAGGAQDVAGLFVAHRQMIVSDWHASAALRADAWQSRDGRRLETESLTGTPRRDEAFPDRRGLTWSPALGLAGQLRPDLKLRLAAYRAFRLPTLNELYRPFRVGDVVTEANPILTREQADGLEAGLDWTQAHGGLAFTVFSTTLHHPVANATLGFGPGTVPGVGFVPAGGVGRQRRNLDTLRARGVELAGWWQAHRALRLRFDYLGQDARLTDRGPAALNLDGLRPAQVPRHTFTAGIDWQPTPAWRLDLALRHSGRAYDDDLNRLPLTPATTLDLRLDHRFTAHDEFYLAVENLGDARVETSRAADGDLTLAPPRQARLGWVRRW